MVDIFQSHVLLASFSIVNAYKIMLEWFVSLMGMSDFTFLQHKMLILMMTTGHRLYRTDDEEDDDDDDNASSSNTNTTTQDPEVNGLFFMTKLHHSLFLVFIRVLGFFPYSKRLKIPHSIRLFQVKLSPSNVMFYEWNFK